MYIPSEPSHRLLVLRASGSGGDSQSAWNYVAGLPPAGRAAACARRAAPQQADRGRSRGAPALHPNGGLYPGHPAAARPPQGAQGRGRCSRTQFEITEPEAAHLPEPKADGIAGASGRRRIGR
ncbi:hypothetical protein DL89DRAFT_182816 [Linderina pennispora]|uniref:Uncharacterized protein n=1 Tax=Linderina pennispora TaxID=61395 RepID=A0A1Y1W5T2_9FUNG|nr:uncharacterized protein DL89DRAFT_182816 [Linderina pennispora]ORX68715.1 hypothetical protein DL89DRAFT_182816 [Linderina pennispora]